MRSYQHSYHAGSLADVHKHMALAVLLEHLTQKNKPLTYMETHAGRGLYDLNSVQAQKTGEAARGILSASIMRQIPHDHPYRRCISMCRQYYGEYYYSGSPAIAQLLLRVDDQSHLMEHHPQEYAALKKNLHDLRGIHQSAVAHIHYRNGYEGVLAIVPPTPRRGLVFIDPSYEIKTEYLQVATFVKALEKKWPQACLMIWYPLLSEGYHIQMLRALALEQRTQYHHSVLPINTSGATSSLRGSGLLIINLPFHIPRSLDFCIDLG